MSVIMETFRTFYQTVFYDIRETRYHLINFHIFLIVGVGIACLKIPSFTYSNSIQLIAETLNGIALSDVFMYGIFPWVGFITALAFLKYIYPSGYNFIRMSEGWQAITAIMIAIIFALATPVMWLMVINIIITILKPIPLKVN